MAFSVFCEAEIIMTEVAAAGRAGHLMGGDATQYHGLNVPHCPTGWLFVESTLPFDSSQIDPSVIVACFSGGFMIYLTCWAAGWGASQLLKLLR